MVGAHVMHLDNRSSWEHWISPMCHVHNHYRTEGGIWLDSRVVLVSANTQRMSCYR